MILNPTLLNLGKALSIGSGGHIDRYVAWLNEFMADSFPYMQGEINSPGGMGQSIASGISMLVRQNPEDSVSNQLHLCRVGFGKIDITPYKMVEITNPSDFPRAYVDDTKQSGLITNWEGFQNFCKDRNLGSGSAVC